MQTNRSIVSPLRIDSVAVPGTGGLIGMTICPGKDEYAGLGYTGGQWKRDLDLDLQVICGWRAEALVTLIEDFEFELLSVPELPGKVHAFGLRWLHLPIVDVWIPDQHFEEQWETAGAELRRILRDGGRIVLHCRGGLGRTGTIAGRLLVEFGMEPREAIRRIRAARSGTIQTREQENYVRQCRSLAIVE
ncbi:MAG TPA: cyclin-dependent kinase inhibitor 3 family protein [Geobacteraceae bacterium]|nr:cyclin-dependent kinase inhibitor 3 family protein [Geobacteraceae bacterium]